MNAVSPGSDYRSDYREVSVTLPAELVEAVVRRVGPNGISDYIIEMLRRHEPQAALADFHRLTAAALDSAGSALDAPRRVLE